MAQSAILTLLRQGEVLKTISVQQELSLGRAESCDIRLEDRSVSRVHAVFQLTPDGVRVEQRSHFSPLMINGALCAEALLKEGDVLTIGPYLIRLSWIQDEQSTQPPVSSEPVSGSPTGADGGGLLSLPAMSLEPLSLKEPSASESSPAAGNAELPFLQDEVAKPEDLGVLPVPQSLEPQDSGSFSALEEDAKTKVLGGNRIRARLIFPAGATSQEIFEIQKNVITIGRGKQCDLVIHEKKASRQHALIQRSENVFLLKDLDSGNGTFINNIRIIEQELTGEETIRIGDLEFRFEMIDVEYIENEKKISQVFPERLNQQAVSLENMEFPEQGVQLESQALSAPLVASVDIQSPLGLPSSVPAPDFTFQEGVVGITDIQNKKKGFLEENYIKYIRNFRSLQPRQQILVAVFIVTVLYFFFFEDEKALKKKKPIQTQQKNITASPQPGKEGTALATLSEGQKRDLEAWHTLAFDYYKNREYDKSLFEIRKIFQLVPDYKDAKEIERYAIEGKRKLEALEEEKRKKEEEAEMRAKIQQLLEEAGQKIKAKKYEEAKEMISQVLANDPENAEVGSFRAEIRAYEEALKQEEELKRARKEINRELSERFEEGVAFKKVGKCYSAIDKFQQVVEGLQEGYLNPKLKFRSLAMIQSCKSEIIRRRDPILKEAQEREQAGEFLQAIELYQKAIQVDSRHPTGHEGVKRIQGLLHERAKAVYTEGVLAESYSDFVTAKKKFQECVEIAPKEDIYYQRAQSKLSRYFKKGLEDESFP